MTKWLTIVTYIFTDRRLSELLREKGTVVSNKTGKMIPLKEYEGKKNGRIYLLLLL